MFPSFSLSSLLSTSLYHLYPLTPSLGPLLSSCCFLWTIADPCPFCPPTPFPQIYCASFFQPPFCLLTLRTFFLCTHHTRPPVQCVNNLRALHDSLNSSMRTSTNCQDSLAEPTLRSLLEKTTHGFSLVSVSCYWTWKGGLVDITAIGSEPGRHLEQSAPIKDQQSP